MGGADIILVALTGSDQVVRATHGTYCGFTIYETGAATAEVLIYDHASAASGTLLEVIRLTANESARECYPRGIRANSGVFVKIVFGAVEGSVRLG